MLTAKSSPWATQDPSPADLLPWLEKHRLPHFCKSSLCLHLVLCQRLLGFIRSGEAGESSQHGGNRIGFSCLSLRLGFLSPRGCHRLVPAQWVVPLLGAKKALHIPFLGMQQVPMGCVGINSTTLSIQVPAQQGLPRGPGLERGWRVSWGTGNRGADVSDLLLGKQDVVSLTVTTLDCAHFTPKMCSLCP